MIAPNTYHLYIIACFSFTFTSENKQNSVNHFYDEYIFIISRNQNSLGGLVIKGCPIQIVGPLHFHSSLGFGKVVSMCLSNFDFSWRKSRVSSLILKAELVLLAKLPQQQAPNEVT